MTESVKATQIAPEEITKKMSRKHIFAGTLPTRSLIHLNAIWHRHFYTQ
ncbi:hypothetical protein ODV97_08360 [Enterococcus gallinarum]|nr:hypothetical protein [Enterococcus gallinarum]